MLTPKIGGTPLSSASQCPATDPDSCITLHDHQRQPPDAYRLRNFERLQRKQVLAQKFSLRHTSASTGDEDFYLDVLSENRPDQLSRSDRTKCLQEGTRRKHEEDGPLKLQKIIFAIFAEYISE